MKSHLIPLSLVFSSSLLLVACDVEFVFDPGCPNPNVCRDRGEGRVSQQLNYFLLNSGFNAANVSIDYSEGNVSLTQNSGYVSLSLILDDGTVVSNAFPWTKQGQSIVFSNPSSVNSWVDPYLSQISEFNYDFNELTVESHAGVNVFVSKIEYASEVLGAGTHSYYIPAGWCDPETRICYDPE